MTTSEEDRLIYLIEPSGRLRFPLCDQLHLLPERISERVGKSLVDLVDSADAEKLHRFLKAIDQEGSVYDWVITTPVQRQLRPLHWAGTSLPDPSGGPKRLKLVVATARRRDLKAHFQTACQCFAVPTSSVDDAVASTLANQPDDAIIYAEFTRLTNELAASERKLFKTNAELRRAYQTLAAESEARLRAERQALRGEKEAALGNLAGGTAHHLNNLLTPIVALSDLAILHTAPGDPNHRLLQQILKAAVRSAELIQDVLTYSRQEFLMETAEPFNLRLAVGAALEQVEPRLPETITLNLEDDLVEGRMDVLGHSERIRLVVEKLLDNALQAIGTDPGRITVHLSPTELPPEDIQALGIAAPAPYGAIRISDTGPGLDDIGLSRAFDPFFTTREVGQGTGLGLSIVQGIVGRHGGGVRLTNNPTQGATAEVFLPLAMDQNNRLEPISADQS